MLIAAELTYLDGKMHPGLAVETDGRLVTALRPLGKDRPELTVSVLAPGLTDLQVNGGGGVLLNTDPSVAGLRAIRDAHQRLGSAAILPTLITDAADVLDAAAEAVIACKGEPGLEGLHIEGPHISARKRGTHEARHIRPLDDRTLAVLARLRQADIPVLLTLAPEETDPSLLRRAAGMGVVVSAGHSMATAAQTRQAISDGVSMFTHLYNAMPQMESRAPGMIAAAILSHAYIGMIADGIHVDWDMLRLAMAARPAGGLNFLVSDAMPTVGGPDRFCLYGREIRVENGQLINAEGALAGAHVSLLDCVRRLHQHADVPLGDALQMASDIPRRAMGLPTLKIKAGLPLTQLLALTGPQLDHLRIGGE